MQISDVQEEVVLERKLYVGMENFHVVALNPTMKELQDMGINATVEPVYVTDVERDLGSGMKTYKQLSLRLFLDNKSAVNPIRTQVSYNILKEYHTSSTNKYLVINKYGNTAWLEEDVITGSAPLPANMTWYVNEGVKKAYRKEEEIISFIKALRNLPFVNGKSDEATKKKGMAMFTQADLDKLFSGDFSDLKHVIVTQSEEQKVGFLLGVRNVEDKFRQTVFAKSPQKAYVAKTNKTERLVEEVKEAQENGAYSDTTFILNDTSLQVFDENVHLASGDDDFSDMDVDDDLPF